MTLYFLYSICTGDILHSFCLVVFSLKIIILMRVEPLVSFAHYNTPIAWNSAWHIVAIQ